MADTAYSIRKELHHLAESISELAKAIVKPPSGEHEEIIYRLGVLQDSVDMILPHGGNEGHTTIHVTEVQQEENTNMPAIDHMPDFTLPSSAVRAVLAVVGPKKADGSYATSPVWSSSDETTVSLEAIPDSTVQDENGNPVLDEAGNPIPVYKTFANTPLTPADGEKVSATVTWKAAGMADVDIKVVYGDPALGHAAITAAEAPEV